MSSTPDKLVSRRQWLGLAGTPALVATVAAGVLGSTRSLQANEMMPQEHAGNDRGARTYNVRDFGAKGDGVILDSSAVQAAIDACTADGGGVVLVPAGNFLIGPIELKSNVTLQVVAGGKLLGSTDGKLYHSVDAIPLEGDSTLGDGNHALIYAVGAKNVTIQGPGMIDGQGIAFFSPVRGQLPPSGLGGNNRPYLLLFHKCVNLTVRGIDLYQSAYHCCRIIQSSYIRLDGIHIYNRDNRNADGFHFISAEHVTISNCHVESQDDACALFGSCKFILVTNSTFSTRWSVFRFGGGIAENVTVSNCLVYQVFGCPIKLHCMPGSRFENMSFSNLVFKDVTGPINISEGPTAPRTPRLDPSGKPIVSHHAGEHSGPSIVRNISFSDIHGTVTTNPPQLPGTPFESTYNPGETHSCISLSAVGDSVLENISFNNVHLTFGGGGTAEDGARRTLPEISGEYFAWGAMPAYGLYARNAKGLTLNNVRFQLAASDARPALILDHVEDVAFNGFSVQGDPASESVLRFTAVKHALVSAPRVLSASSPFLQIEGTQNEAIVIDGGDLSRASQPLVCKEGALNSAVRVRGV